MIDTTSQWVSADIQIVAQHREIAIDFAMALGGLAIVEQDDIFQVSYPLDNETQVILDELKTFIMDLDNTASIS